MKIPEDVQLIEHPMATFWFDEEGILYSVSKHGARTIEVMTEYIEFLQKLLNSQPVCVLTDISKAGQMDKETRNFTATQLPKVFRAMAILSNTQAGNTIGKIFMTLDGQPIPTAMFSDEDEAIDWLRNYL